MEAKLERFFIKDGGEVVSCYFGQKSLWKSSDQELGSSDLVTIPNLYDGF